MDELPPVVVVSRTSDTAEILRAMGVIAQALTELREQPTRVILDALISIYLRLAIFELGIEGTGEALRLQRENLPTIAAKMAPPD